MFAAHIALTDLFAVFRVGEVNEVIIVHFLGVDDVTVLFLAQVLGVNAIGSQKFLVSHTERLTNGLSDKLGLQTNKNNPWKLMTQCVFVIVCC